MQYDRKITITVGNNRKSINWQPQSIMLSEFYEKLRIPSRSTETMSEYLNLKSPSRMTARTSAALWPGASRGPGARPEL